MVPIYSLVHTIFRCQLSGVMSIILLRFFFQGQPVVLSPMQRKLLLLTLLWQVAALGVPWKTRPLKFYMLLGSHFMVPFYPLSHLHQWLWTLCSRIVQESFIVSLCLEPFDKTLILLFLRTLKSPQTPHCNCAGDPKDPVHWMTISLLHLWLVISKPSVAAPSFVNLCLYFQF